MKCKKTCGRDLDCNKHKCEQPCGGEQHSHKICNVLVNYTFPDCKHPGDRKKKCTLPITWRCHKVSQIKLACAHVVDKECWKKDADVVCDHPCTKTRSCGHPCQSPCGKNCEAADCKLCAMQREAEKKAAHSAIKQTIETWKKKITEKAGFKLIEIKKDGPTAAEFTSVVDKVTKYINPVHNWYPNITKIELIQNPHLELKFEQAKLNCFGTHTDLKFHGTGDEGIKHIPEKGFRLPQPAKPGEQKHMFGCGIYFATDSSKSAQPMYTKGANKLLLCNVLVGKAKRVDRADYTLTKEKLKQEGFDSVFAPRGTQSTGGVMNDEFVVFDPDQALPKYIIYYTPTPFQNVKTNPLSTITKETFLVKTIKDNRVVDMNDPYKPHYDRAYTMFSKVPDMFLLRVGFHLLQLGIGQQLG